MHPRKLMKINQLLFVLALTPLMAQPALADDATQKQAFDETTATVAADQVEKETPAVAKGKSSVKKMPDTVVQAESLTVTAKRYESEQIKTPAFTTVVTEAEMARVGGANAYEVLKRTGGVNFTSHMPFGMHMGSMSSSVGFRGLKNGELVLLNGLPVMDPGYGYYDIDMIPTAFLERIEVVKGAGSTLYGSQAETGVIDLQLKQPGVKGAGGQIMGGSHNAADTSVYARNENFLIGAYYARADELTDLRKYYSANAPYNTSILQWERAASLLSYKPWDTLTITHMYNYLDSGWDRDYYKKRTSNYDVLETSNRHYLQATYEKNGLKVSPFYTYNYFVRDYEYAATGKPDSTSVTNNYTAGLNAQQLLNFGKTDLLIGTDYLYQNQDDDTENITGSSPATYKISHQIMQHDRHQGALFGRIEHELSSKLQIAGGLRLVGVWETEEDADNYFEPLPQVQLLYPINGNNSLYTNVGRSFKVPAFGQMYMDYGNYTPNPNLEPEQGWTYEAGWKTQYKQFSSTVSVFFMDFTDKLNTNYIDSLQKYQYQNMDEFQSTGVEWQMRYRFLNNYSLILAGYAADPYEILAGVKEQAGAKFQLAPGIEYTNDKLTIGLNAEMYYSRERGLKDYTNIHLNASYAATESVKLKLNIDNLLDDRNEVLYGNMSPSATTQYVTYDPGILIMAGVEFNF